MKGWLFGRILLDLEHAKTSVELIRTVYGEDVRPGETPYISQDEIIRASRWPHWLAIRAINWRDRRNAMSGKPPLSLQ
jgi:hypothetical protein